MTGFLIGLVVGMPLGVLAGAGFVIRRHLHEDEAEIDQAMAADEPAPAVMYDQVSDERVLCVRCPEVATTLTGDGVPVCAVCLPVELGR
jgi:hypothetical protein